MSRLDPISVLCRVLLLSWCLLALPVTIAGLYGASEDWAIGMFGVPFALANLAAFLLAVLPRSAEIHTTMSLMTIAGSLTSLATLALFAVGLFGLGYIVLLFPAIGSGGTQGPFDALMGLAAWLAPAGIGVVLFLLFPLPFLMGLRPK